MSTVKSKGGVQNIRAEKRDRIVTWSKLTVWCRSQRLHHKALLQAVSQLRQLYSTKVHPGSLSKKTAVLILESGLSSGHLLRSREDVNISKNISFYWFKPCKGSEPHSTSTSKWIQPTLKETQLPPFTQDILEQETFNFPWQWQLHLLTLPFHQFPYKLSP